MVAAMVAAQPKEILMTKAKSKRKPASRTNNSKPKARKSVRRTTARKTGPATESATRKQPRLALQLGARCESKKAHIIAMLRAPNGVTIEAMTRATKWQPHSVRGFLAGVVRKKLGLTLVSAGDANGRIYRIMDGTAAAAA